MYRARTVALLLLWAIGASLVVWTPSDCLLTARAESASAPSWDDATRKDVMVPMRDGTKLATDIYFPSEDGKAAEGRFPVVLIRTPYGKTGQGRSAAKALVPAGYIVVSQDTRGRGNSEGIWHWMTDDRDDGYDAVEWIARQPWSNGKVGMSGCSYVGATQHLAAMAKPPHLTTIIPSNPSINHGIGSTIYAGAFRLRVWNWVISNAAKGSRQARDPHLREALGQMAKDRQFYLNNLPLRRGLTPLRLAPEYEAMLLDMMAHRRNDDYWRFSNIIDYVDEHKKIPVLMVGGWYDLFSSSTTETYQALRRTNSEPVCLLMGPWPHCSTSRAHGQVDFGPDATFDLMKLQRAWYDRWLKETPAKEGQPVPFPAATRIFVMGTGDGHKTDDGKLFHGGYWRDEADYPPPQAVATPYYFQNDGGLSPQLPEAQKASSTFEFDPENPVPTIGGCIVGSVSGAWNQWGGGKTGGSSPMPLSARNDVLVFMTPPLERDTEIIGPIRVKLWVSSSAVDTDFTAKLIDSYPSSDDFPAGFDLIMGDGIVRARYRESNPEDTLLTPGKIYELDIKLDPCCNVFKRGHRIRVDLSSSNYPRFDANPNTGEAPNDNRRKVKAVNTIYHDRLHPSSIELPIMPKSTP